MKHMCKRILAAFLAAALISTGLVCSLAETTSADRNAAYNVDRMIAAIGQEQFMFNSCDNAADQLIANLNSGGDIKELAAGQGINGGDAVKFIKKSDGATEHNEAFRLEDGINTADYTAVEFDLFLSDGLTVSSGWSPLCLQSANASNSDNDKYASVDMKDLLSTLTPGGWNHVTVDISNCTPGVAKQIALRFYQVFVGAAGEYIMVDNLMLTKEKEVTFNDMPAITAAINAYEMLSETQKALVTETQALNTLKAFAATYDEAPQKVMKAIDDLMTQTVVFNNCDAQRSGDAEIIANINSGALSFSIETENVAEGSGAAKYTLKNGACDMPMMVRGDEIDLTEYQTFEFDLFLSSGMTIDSSQWGNLHVQTSWTNNMDENKAASISIVNACSTLKPGEWNHVVIDIANVTAATRQFTLRPYKIFSGTAGEYVLLDNVVVRGAKELTLADKEAALAVKAQYDALDNTQKALVTNYNQLADALQKLDGTDASSLAVKAAIDALAVDTTVLNNCDNHTNQEGTELIANVNSGAVDFAMESENITEGTAAAKYILKNGACDLPMMVRSAAVDLKDYENLEFDLYISSGITIDNTQWGNLHVQTSWTNNMDQDKAAALSFSGIINALTPGAWNHVVMNIGDVTANAKQLTLRFYQVFDGAAGEYVILDNVVITKPKTVTYADKNAILAVQSDYEALNDIQKTAVTNYSTLQEYLDMIATYEAAAKTVEEKIAALKEAAEITLDDKQVVLDARAAYDALESTQKALVTNLDRLQAAESAVAALEGSTEAAEKVMASINTLPSVNEITLEDEAKISAVRAGYNELSDIAKALVTNRNILEAAEDKIAQLKEEAANQVKQVEDAITALGIESFVFSDCDALRNNDLDIAANINSGNLAIAIETANKTQGNASIKLTKTTTAACDYPLGLRREAIAFTGYKYLEFDIYLSDGITVAELTDTSWSNVALQTDFSNNTDEHKFATLDMKNEIAASVPGQWNHIKLALPEYLPSSYTFKQVSIRPGNNSLLGAVGDYILIDNVVISKPQAPTYAKKAAIEAVQAEFNKLTEAQQAAVSNADILKGYIAMIDDTKQAAADVIDLITALPAANDITLANREAVEKAKADFEALDDAAKALVTNQDQLTAAVQKISLLTDAQTVIDLIANLPAVAAITLENKQAVADARTALDALNDTAKALVTNKDILEAAETKIAQLEQAKLVIDQIAALPSAEAITLTDKQAVTDARTAYNNLSDAVKTLVTNVSVLEAAEAKIASLVNTLELGDVNGDKEIDAKDALIVLKIAVGKYTATDAEKIAANVNKDTAIDAKDALEILKYAVGKITTFN